MKRLLLPFLIVGCNLASSSSSSSTLFEGGRALIQTPSNDQQQQSCDPNNVRELERSILVTFIGSPDLVPKRDLRMVGMQMREIYNQLTIGCFNPNVEGSDSQANINGFRTLQSATLSTVPDFGFPPVTMAAFSIEYLFRGVCQNCPRGANLFLLPNEPPPCGCQPPSRTQFQIELQERINTLISTGQINSNLVGIDTLVELETLNSCDTQPIRTFTTDVLINFGPSVEQSITPSERARLPSLFLESYNVCNGLNSNTCDFYFRQILTIRESFNTVFDAFQYRIVVRCRGCDPTTARAFHDEVDFFPQPPTMLPSTASQRQRRRLPGNELAMAVPPPPVGVGSVDSDCRCPINPKYRAVTREKVRSSMERAIRFSNFTSIDRVKGIFEVKDVSCSPQISNFRTSFIVQVTSTEFEVSNDALQAIAVLFLRSYNTLRKSYCDPQFRVLADASVPPVRLTPEVLDGGQRRRRLQFGYTFPLETNGNCRGCTRDADATDDGFRRRRRRGLFQSTNNDKYFTDEPSFLFPSSPQDYDRDRRFLQGAIVDCICPVQRAPQGVPTLRDLKEQLDSDLRAEGGILASFNGVLSIEEQDKGALRGNRIQCVTNADCAAFSATLCVSGFCINEGNPRITLTWEGDDDLDLFVVTPGGAEISGNQVFDEETSGLFDSRISQDTNGTHLESVFFPLDSAAPGGVYTFRVGSEESRGISDDMWTVNVFKNGTLIDTFTGAGTSGNLSYFHADVQPPANPPASCVLTNADTECCVDTNCPSFPNQVCTSRQCVTVGNPRVTLSWYGADDLNLRVRVPGGTTIDESNPRDAPSGGVFVPDNNANRTTATFHTESVTFPNNTSAPNGTYFYYLESKRFDGTVPDNWEIQVFVDGNVVGTRNGARTSSIFNFTLGDTATPSPATTDTPIQSTRTSSPDTLQPTSSPVSPTPQPVAAPVDGPTRLAQLPCADAPQRVSFWLKENPCTTCAWLAAAKPNLRTRYCVRTHPAFVYCPRTCGRCLS